MSNLVGILLSIFLMVLSAIITYKIGERVSSRIIKYIPTISTGVGLIFFYIRINFIPYKTHAFDGLMDIPIIFLLAIVFGVSLLLALWNEFTNKGNSHWEN
jgi:predicted tellurium resistance membrane protein TerC